MTAREKYYEPIKERVNNPLNVSCKENLKKQQINYEDVLDGRIDVNVRYIEDMDTEMLKTMLIFTIKELSFWSYKMDEEERIGNIIEQPENWNDSRLLLAQFDPIADQYKKYVLYGFYDQSCMEFFDKANKIMDKLGWSRT